MTTQAATSPRRVLWVLPNLAGGGAERAIATLLPRLDPTHVEAHLCLFRAEGVFLDAVANAVPVHDLGVNGRSDPRLLWRLSRLIRRLQPDATIGVLRTCGVLTAIAHRLAGRPGRILINEQNHPSREMAQYGRSRLRHQLLAAAYARVDQIVAISDSIRHDLIHNFGLPAPQVSVIANPVSPDVAQLAQAPAPHPWLDDNGRCTLVSVGRLHPQKGHDLLLTAFAQVQAAHPDTRLLIVGDGPQKSALTRQIRELELGNAVELAGFRQNPYAFMARAHLFVLASRYEGFGIVLAEALTLGVPVVATDCPGGPREILANGRFGHLVPPENAAALAQAIATLIADPAQRQTLAQQARTQANRYAATTIAAATTTFLHNITESK